MRITALEVDGFGVWTGLKLEGLSEGLNVFYGPNEAGKTTLMQFVRSVLYGFSADRRRYLPPAQGGKPGGMLELAVPSGRFQVARHAGDGGGEPQEELAILAADGTRQGEHLLKTFLSNIDESIFNNVFAVGLEELQELRTLNDTEAAALLYNLSAGLDRVSLVEVMQELRASRNRLLDAAGGPSQVLQLLSERDKLLVEIEDLQTLTGRYARLAGERQQADREAARLGEETAELAYQCRVLEIAISLRERWQKRQTVDRQITSMGVAERVPEGAVERLDTLTAALAERQSHAEEFKLQRDLLRGEAQGLPVNENLSYLAPRIEALAEQEDWIGKLETRTLELQAEISAAETKLAAQSEQFGLEQGEFPAISARSLAALRRPAGAMRRTAKRLEEAKRDALAGREMARSLGEKVQSALSGHGERDLAVATDRIGSLVAQLRRRVQIDQRLEQLERLRNELEDQGRASVDREMLSPAALAGLGSVFVIGLVPGLLHILGWVLSTPFLGATAWPLTILGFVAAGGAILAKFQLERSNRQRLDDRRKQLGMLQLQIKQAGEEREELDKQLPRGGGPIASRLEAAERELAELEEILPLDAKRQAIQEETEAATARATKRKRNWPRTSGVGERPFRPPDYPRDSRQAGPRNGGLRRFRSRNPRAAGPPPRRTRPTDPGTGRSYRPYRATGAGCGRRYRPADARRAVADPDPTSEPTGSADPSPPGDPPGVAGDSPQTGKARSGDKPVETRSPRLLERAGVKDEQELRQRAAQQARTASLWQEREDLQREIEAAIAGHCPEETVGQQMEGDPVALESRRAQLEKRRQACEAQAQQRFEKRGQFNEQMKVLAENRTPGVKQLELAMLETRLDEVFQRWRVLAVTHRVLENVRATYERTRQPETLQEASIHLARLTQDRYVRVWTPLGESGLLVDDHAGRPLAVEVLSRGTREQLFLSLRLALASSYARRGAPLPLLLDDVLVNCDVERAKAAAAVLHDFASAGHQLLVFTCHEHIAKLFESLKTEVTRLPANAQAAVTVTVASKPPKKQTRRKSRPEPEPDPNHEVTEEEGADPDPEALDPGRESRDDEERRASIQELAPWEEDENETAGEHGEDEEEEDGASTEYDEDQPFLGSADADDAEAA